MSESFRTFKTERGGIRSFLFMLLSMAIPGIAQEHWELINQSDMGSDDIEFVSAHEGWAGAIWSSGYGLYHTTDGGYTWDGVPGTLHFSISEVAFYDSNRGLALGTSRGLVTFDGGDNWQWTWSPPGTPFQQAVYIDSLTIIGISTTLGPSNARNIIRSADGGLTWSLVYSDTAGSGGFNCITASTSGTVLIGAVGFEPWAIYRSADAGFTWAVAESLRVGTLGSVAPGVFVASTRQGDARAIARSTDDGLSWTIVWSDSTSPGLYDIDFPDSLRGWVVGWSGTVVETADGGASWQFYVLETGVSGLWSASFIDSTLGWAVGYGGGGGTRLFRYSIPAGTASQTLPELPAGVSLDAIFPNPMNSTAQISYTVARPGFVQIEILDLLGRQVARLVEDQVPGGSHMTLWRANGLATGEYFCRLIHNHTQAEVARVIYLK